MRDIYVTSPDPQHCAKALDDKTLDKALKDVFAVCARAITHHGGVSVFATANPGPWDLWARETFANYEWLCAHLIYLSFEWKFRGNRQDHINHPLFIKLAEQRHIVPDLGHQTMFPNCTRFAHILDPVVAYRLHLSEMWCKAKDEPVWGPSGSPPWRVKPEDLDRIMERLQCV